MIEETSAREVDYESINIGESVEFQRLITVNDVNNFADLTGDFNPLHMNEEYASQTKFKGRLAHGMLIGSLFSTLVGMHLPGKKCLYLSQSLFFKSPLKIGTKVKVKGKVTKKTDALKILVIKTEVLDEDNKLIVDGEAKVRVMEGQNER